MEVIAYLSNPSVFAFLIISDINMPKIDGFELRERIMSIEEIGVKCIPYIFLSTSKNPENVLKAHTCKVQGYFKKQEDSLIIK